MIKNLPKPFYTGIRISNLQRKETENRGLVVTNCLFIYMLKKDNEDALLVLRIGYKDGQNISNLFGLGDLDTLEFQENTIEEARD